MRFFAPATELSSRSGPWLGALGAGIVAGAVTIAFLGLETYCDKTPPCPPGTFCILIKIVGPCGVNGFNVAAAVVIGLAAAGLFLAVARARRGGLPVRVRRPLIYGVLAVPLGLLYGYLSLEAMSGLAPVVLVEIAGVALLARRVPRGVLTAAAAAAGFACGFAGVWVAVLAGRPYCCGPGTDALWAMGFVGAALLPALLVWRATRPHAGEAAT